MSKILVFFIATITALAGGAHAVTARTATTSAARSAMNSAATPTSAYNYNYMYPYLSNQMRTDLNPGVTPDLSANPISVITRTEQMNPGRRVVPRAATTSRSATATNSSGTATTSAAVRAATTAANSARAATASATTTRGATSAATTSTNARAAVPTATSGDTRRVVARGNTRTTSTARSARGDASYLASASDATAINNSTTVSLPASRCLADYTECMNDYCQREKTEYNRCYCSAKLAQIDAQYQPAIDNLIKQLLRLQGTNQWTDAEMNQYWMDTVGKYTGDNSWVNLDNALDINWADTESRVRGQQAFATGHDYCVQHLRGCYYMASNMRDAYRSEIARDCATYESSLQRLQRAIESLVETYNE
ncbi:MAG: hypothetical protein K2L94_02755 [Alphaproteobacteria bacterium]|nr:hypothetical protein [Alphaproteobacteria bacterium]